MNSTSTKTPFKKPLKQNLIHVGIDPGLVVAGVVIEEITDDGPIYHGQAFQFHVTSKTASPVKRAILAGENLVQHVHNCVFNFSDSMVEDVTVVVGIELPVYSVNPSTLGIQWRLIQELERSFYHLFSQDMQLVVREMDPTQPKKALTGKGNATKDMMVETALPMLHDVTDQAPKYVKETIADALGVLLAAKDGKGNGINYNDLRKLQILPWKLGHRQN